MGMLGENGSQAMTTKVLRIWPLPLSPIAPHVHEMTASTSRYHDMRTSRGMVKGLLLVQDIISCNDKWSL